MHNAATWARPAAALLTLWAAAAAAPTAQGEEHFRSKIAPLLEQRCLRCHRGVAARGKLALDSAAGLLRGGESGAAIVPGQPDESLLLTMVTGDAPDMPQQGPPLTAAEVDALRQWIAAGAPWPDGVLLKLPPGDDDLWSLQPLAAPTIPSPADDWPRTPVDAFVAARLRQEQLTPATEADRAVLIRRLCFDLHGLPPSPEEVDAFVADDQPCAYDRLVDRLLASPRYGERWGRHWLDVAHYGETHGYDKDKRRPNAWPYRDYVIAALNADLPYGQFIQQQIAGDALWPDDPQAVIASSFIAAGPWDFVGHVELGEDTVEKRKTRLLDRDDMVTAAMSSFVSLTVQCARCHDHPFDPIPQADYYRLQAVFAGVDRADRTVASPQGELTVYGLKRLDAPRQVFVLARGNLDAPREPAEPGALSAVRDLSAEFDPAGADEGARRAALAHWLSDRRNVLVWRSQANRLWHYHFGRGLVDTPNDLGHNAAPPTHPALLDWLAVRLRDDGQSLKSLHRLLVVSAVYRQSSADHPHASRHDGDNRWLWRAPRRRLEAEAIRDAALYVADTLDERLGGPSFDLFEFEDDHSPRYKYTVFDTPAVHRRTVYRSIVRSVPNPLLETLDCADASLSTPARSSTITALQALALLNNPFLVRQAEYLAQRVARECADLPQQIDRACRLTLGRPLPADDQAALVEYAAQHGLAAACRVLLNHNEFVFVD